MEMVDDVYFKDFNILSNERHIASRLPCNPAQIEKAISELVTVMKKMSLLTPTKTVPGDLDLSIVYTIHIYVRRCPDASIEYTLYRSLIFDRIYVAFVLCRHLIRKPLRKSVRIRGPSCI
jgi:hypothetical protein